MTVSKDQKERFHKVSMPGRNELCPCGSKVKFKKCHGSAARAIPAVVEAGRAAEAQMLAKQESRRGQFGDVRPIIHADFKGQKFVGVGSQLHRSAHWRTFIDFLSDYVQKRLQGRWYHDELAKPIEQRHPIAQWYWYYCAFQQRHAKDEQTGLFHGTPDGPSMAHLLLAYELYLVDDHMALQPKLLDRLLNPVSFQSARYEITVAATMIRAGFSLTMENEDDPTKRHPEFIATDPKSGVSVAVEAKSRRRAGVLGFDGTARQVENLAHDVRRLFRESLNKATSLPLFVFIDANLEPSLAKDLSVGFADAFWPMVVKEAKPINDDGIVVGNPHNLLMLTNSGFHYGAPGEPLPSPLFWSYWPDPAGCRYPVAPELIRRVETSLEQSANIPNYFE